MPTAIHISVFMALEEEDFFNKKRSVNLSERNLQTIDGNILKQYAEHCEYLDLSGNHLSLDTLTNWIYDFPHLKCLILDGNRLSERHLELNRSLCHLKVLMLDKNEFSDLLWMANLLHKYFPNLHYLSLHGNPVCPNREQLFHNYSSHEYEQYKKTLRKALPKLRFLDHVPLDISTITSEVEDLAHSPVLPSSLNDDIWTKIKRFLSLKNQRSKQPNNLYEAVTSYRGTHSEGNRFITNSDL